MAKYIDAELFEKELEKLHYSGEICVSEKLVDFISKFPSVEVKEVVNGKRSNGIGDSHSSGKDRCCGTCEYGRYDYASGYVCVNGDSWYTAEFVEHDFTCENWQKKEVSYMESLLKKYGRG